MQVRILPRPFSKLRASSKCVFTASQTLLFARSNTRFTLAETGCNAREPTQGDWVG